jgi:hypothetical protein
MKYRLTIVLALAAMALFSVGALSAADAKAATLTCVGLYSETEDGHISYRVGSGQWTVIKVGDVIPANAEVRVNVDRDWVEFIATGKPLAAYEIDGPESGGEIVKKVADILKGKARTVAFPVGTKDKPDSKFSDKLVVTKYLGRQIYVNPSKDSKDIKYGDVLSRNGKIKIIATNNTIDLMNASAGSTTVIGPLNFTVDQVLDNKNLYKYLNVQ